MTAEAVRTVLSRWFPGEDITVERAGAGVSTPVFVARVGSETYYARLAEAPGERRDGEVAVHRMLTAAGVSVPVVVRHEPMPPELDRSIALTTRIPGAALAGMEAGEWPPAAGRAAGEALARINQVPVRGYGWVVDVASDGVLAAEHLDRPAWVAEYLRAAKIVVTSGVLHGGCARVVASAVERWAETPGAPASHLAHGDFDATHIHVDTERGGFTGIIDFGEIRGADRLYDLGHLLLHDGASGRSGLFPHVLDGYRSAIALPDDAMDQIRMQAIAIATRALAIQLRQVPSPYRDWLAQRLRELIP